MSNRKLQKLLDLVDQHERWRTSSLNLVAAENVASPMVKRFATTDLAGRYGDFIGRDLTQRKYYGTEYVIQIEQEVKQLIHQVFKAEYVEYRPLSGHIAGSAVIMGLTEPGDWVLEVGSNGGGHRLAEKITHASLTKLEVEFLAIDGNLYNIDIEKAIGQIQEKKPSLIILGSSNFLFPHPVREIAEAIRTMKPKPVLAYDASHVLGLIAGGCFQDPLAEGADLMLGSTHKTFPGPQGGLILSNNEDIINRVSEATYPGLITNHHLARLPGLGVALLEMINFGKEYADTVISNAQFLASELAAEGIRVVGEKQGFTRSHTVLVSTHGIGNNKDLAKRLEDSKIIVNAVTLPPEQGGAGLRLGTQEITRRGADKETIGEVARHVSAVLTGQVPVDAARKTTEAIAGKLNELRFTFQN